jgi:hypothetical protein
VNLVPAAQPGHGGVQPPCSLALAHEARGKAAAEQQREAVAERARPVELDHEVELLALHVEQELSAGARLEELLGDSGETREAIEAIERRGTVYQIRGVGERNQMNLGVRQRGSQSAKRRGRADKIAEPAGSQNSNTPRLNREPLQESRLERIRFPNAFAVLAAYWRLLDWLAVLLFSLRTC